METKAKILVVDDDKEIADLVEIHLVSEGYDVKKANDAVTGLAILKAEEDISLAILDIMMPGTDGIEALYRIRESEKRLKIPEDKCPKIIMVSALSDMNYVDGAFELGCDGYANKPLDTDKMEEVLKKLELIK